MHNSGILISQEKLHLNPDNCSIDHCFFHFLHYKIAALPPLKILRKPLGFCAYTIELPSLLTGVVNPGSTCIGDLVVFPPLKI
jgi:hypothetical protein